ncbi:lytic transglycosylase domain-containing protein [Frankia sp. R82]|uniref:lytic transglycosylase domain-containing protein n=1 Tax=Frankia sp. R82 TaxID=2950553 RepID=UPI0020447315|nr:lytic transglycosylase domain-containing protein [Frankia sp. R82]MCM3886308.1 lytic transglycosylase domain-containing protein [Frankia sp. R82]
MSRHRHAADHTARHRSRRPARDSGRHARRQHARQHARRHTRRRDVRRGPATGLLATLAVIGLLGAVGLGPGAVGPETTSMATAAPASIAHPPARDYDDDVPPLIAAHPPTADAPPAATPGQAGQPVAGTPEPGNTTAPAVAGPDSSTSTVTLTAAERRIPARVLDAYRAAERRAAAQWPGCHLHWQLLAGIGRVESGHGVGRVIRADDTITTPILGPALDGQNGRALIRDTDSGRLDGDRRFDRAVGPMQFIPTTWAWAGRDGSGDGRADPNNVDDAALAAAGYLCGHRHDLAEPASLRAAILTYNPSDSYVRAVLAWSAAYTTIGALPGPTVTPPATHPGSSPTALAPPPAPAPTTTPAVATSVAGPATAGSSGGSPTPDPSPDPTPDPAAEPPPRPTPSPVPSAPGRRTVAPFTAPTSNPQATTSRAGPSEETSPAVSPSDALLVIALTPQSGSGSPRAPTSTP